MSFTTLHETTSLPVLTLVTFTPEPSPVPEPLTLSTLAVRMERRARLVSLLRHAFLMMQDASEAHQDAFTAITPSAEAIAVSETRCKHLSRRYATLETVIADESGLPAFAVFNQVANSYPLVSRLLTAGL